MRGARRAGAALCWALAFTLAWARGADAACRLALLLAVDVSSSVDGREHALQRNGLAAALIHPDIQDAILNGPGEVALAIYEWSGKRQQRVVVDWTMLRGPADILSVAEAVQTSPRSYDEFPTAMGYALAYGHAMLQRAPPCVRRVIDLSGDGRTNDGFGPQLAYKHFDFSEIVVNGLAIRGADIDIVEYFERQLAHGPLSFVEVARTYDDFERAMVRKLYRELSEAVFGSASPRP